MPDTANDDGPRSEPEFRRELQRLLSRATDNGVDVQGGWVVERPPENHDLDVHISRVASRSRMEY